MERIATVPHRSRFQAAELPIQEDFTYVADVGIKNRFPSWYPAMLRWSLTGLHAYRQIRFSQMPPGCLAFKQDILADKDVVKTWLDSVLQPGEADDFVKVCDLFQEFGIANRAFQNDRKTKKTAGMFEKELHRILGGRCFKSTHKYTLSNGKQTTAGRVFMGLKRSP